jgi:hypothetical protein
MRLSFVERVERNKRGMSKTRMCVRLKRRGSVRGEKPRGEPTCKLNENGERDPAGVSGGPEPKSRDAMEGGCATVAVRRHRHWQAMPGIIINYWTSMFFGPSDLELALFWSGLNRH